MKITEKDARSCPFNYRHEWRQKMGYGATGHDGYYCIYCLKEVE